VGTPQLSNDVINTPQGQSIDQSSISLMNIKAPKRPPIYIFTDKKRYARVFKGRVNLKVVGALSCRVFFLAATWLSSSNFDTVPATKMSANCKI